MLGGAQLSLCLGAAGWSCPRPGSGTGVMFCSVGPLWNLRSSPGRLWCTRGLTGGWARSELFRVHRSRGVGAGRKDRAEVWGWPSHVNDTPALGRRRSSSAVGFLPAAIGLPTRGGFLATGCNRAPMRVCLRSVLCRTAHLSRRAPPTFPGRARPVPEDRPTPRTTKGAGRRGSPVSTAFVAVGSGNGGVRKSRHP